MAGLPGRDEAVPHAGVAFGWTTCDLKTAKNVYALHLQTDAIVPAVEQVMLDISKGRLGKVTEGQQAALINIAKQIDAVKAQEEAEKLLAKAIKETSDAQEDFFAAVIKSDEAKQNKIASLLNATPSADLERQREDMQLLTAEFQRYIDTVGAAGISEEKYIEAVNARLGLTGDKIEKTKTLAEELNLSFTSAFEDAIVGGKGLSDVLKGLEQDILRIITRKAVTDPLGNAFAGMIGNGGGFDIGGLVSSLFSFDGGGYTGSGSRSGGLDGKGGFMAMLHPQETIVDHTKGQATGGIVVNQSFTVGDVASVSMVRQAVANSQRQLVAAMSRSNNYGGAV